MRRIGLSSSRPVVCTPAPTPTLAEVYASHFRYVWRCLRGLGVAESQLDDAVQDVFVVVHKRLPDFDGQARITTWLYEIALRVARKYRARAAKVAQRELPATPDPAPVEPPILEKAEHELDCAARLRLARMVLDAMPPTKREVFVLACVEQRSAPEIADLTGVPTNTVYSRIRAAKHAFALELRRLRARREGPRR